MLESPAALSFAFAALALVLFALLRYRIALAAEPSVGPTGRRIHHFLLSIRKRGSSQNPSEIHCYLVVRR